MVSPVRIGRNDPCYCGSGKKYKKCCLNKPPSPEEAARKEVLAASEQLKNQVLEFTVRNFGDRFEEAWEDFNFGDIDGPFDPKDPFSMLFIPFFIFLWDPENPDGETTDNIRGGIIAREFLLKNGSRLTEMERDLLRSNMTTPFTFYEILSVQQEQGFSARDILTNLNFQVHEKMGTRSLAVGDILYGQMCHVGGITTMSFNAPYPIPPRLKAAVIKLRQILQETKGSREFLSEQDLREFADDTRERYLEIVDQMMAPPVLVNTDGELLEFHTMKFDIPSAQAAFDALAPLHDGVPPEALLHSAEYDSNGALSKVEIQWLKKGNKKFKTWENTVHGKIRIHGRSLEAEANSEERARKLRREIEKRLGRDGAIYQGTEVKKSEEVLDMLRREEPSRMKSSRRSEEEIEEDPESQKVARDFMQKEYDAWVDKKLPILGGKTPKQAVKDPDGREIVESMLLQFERTLQDKPEGVRPNLSGIRKRLNLQ